MADPALPHNLEAERSVLGAVLLHNEALDHVEELQAPDFFRRAHQQLYVAMLTLREAGMALDLVTLKEELARTGTLDEVGGPAYIAALVDGVPRSANVEYYAAIVVEHARRRAAITEASKLQQRAYEAEEPAASIVGDAAERLAALCERSTAGKAVPLSEVVPGGLAALQRARLSGSVVTGLATHYTVLDELTTGFQPSDLIVVAARTSVGKTAFALSVARNVSRHGGTVLFHSFEMSRDQLFLRLLAADARIEIRRLRSGRLSDVEWHRVYDCAQRLADVPILIDDLSEPTCRSVRARARAAKGLSLIVVDYLGLMAGQGKFDNRTQEIGTITRGLKRIAREFNVPVLALSQLNRSPEQRRAKRPQLSDLRESGDIEQDASVVILLYRPEEADEGIAEAIVAKQRNGPVGTARLAWLDYCARFENLEAA